MLIARGAAAMLLALLGSLATVSGASAASHNGACEAGEICLFKDSGGNGGIVDFTETRIDDYRGFNFMNCGSSCNLNDRASSLNVLRTSGTVRFFRDAGCMGLRFTQTSPGHRLNLTQDHWDGLTSNPNDQFSSHCV